MGGSVRIDGHARVEHLAQHQLEQLDGASTPLRTMLERDPGDGSNAHELRLRNALARFGLSGDTLPHQAVRTLSGGQKCRLCLAAAMHRRPHLLVLDEPTNHLDMETTDALIKAIQDFKGAVLVVSHDEHLLTSACNELWVVGGGKAEQFRGTFAQYKKEVIAGKR